MKRLSFVALVLVSLVINSCILNDDNDDKITSPIILSDKEHHVGDNTGAEGLSLYAEFEMPKTFKNAEMDVTFVYPDEAGTSGPDVDTPPEITINDLKVGPLSSDFKKYPECISKDNEFHCTIVFTFIITDKLHAGNNVFKITSKAYFDNYDDFSFSDVVIRFEK